MQEPLLGSGERLDRYAWNSARGLRRVAARRHDGLSRPCSGGSAPNERGNLSRCRPVDLSTGGLASPRHLQLPTDDAIVAEERTRPLSRLGDFLVKGLRTVCAVGCAGDVGRRQGFVYLVSGAFAPREPACHVLLAAFPGCNSRFLIRDAASAWTRGADITLDWAAGVLLEWNGMESGTTLGGGRWVGRGAPCAGRPSDYSRPGRCGMKIARKEFLFLLLGEG